MLLWDVAGGTTDETASAASHLVLVRSGRVRRLLQ
jgi:hypothetical protein